MWIAAVGITDKDDNRYEPGDRVPDKVVKGNKWLIEQGAVEESD